MSNATIFSGEIIFELKEADFPFVEMYGEEIADMGVYLNLKRTGEEFQGRYEFSFKKGNLESKVNEICKLLSIINRLGKLNSIDGEVVGEYLDSFKTIGYENNIFYLNAHSSYETAEFITLAELKDYFDNDDIRLSFSLTNAISKQHVKDKLSEASDEKEFFESLEFYKSRNLLPSFFEIDIETENFSDNNTSRSLNLTVDIENNQISLSKETMIPTGLSVLSTELNSVLNKPVSQITTLHVTKEFSNRPQPLIFNIPDNWWPILVNEDLHTTQLNGTSSCDFCTKRLQKQVVGCNTCSFEHIEK